MGRSACPFASVKTKLHFPAGIGVAAPAGNAMAHRIAIPHAFNIRVHPYSSGVVEAHRLAHVAHRLVCEVGSLLASILDDVADQRRVLLVLRRALADRLY